MNETINEARTHHDNDTSPRAPPAKDARHASWAELLKNAIRNPGLLHSAYQQFHRYSVGNQLLALSQCNKRDLSPSPLNTFMGWKDLGRRVRKGEKALALCMPVISMRQDRAPPSAPPDEQQAAQEPGFISTAYTRFIYPPRWFLLSQTEGEPYTLPPMPTWNKEQALLTLDVREVAFERLDGNVQGYAIGKSIAISPVAALPHKTLFHELGHILLGHTTEACCDQGATPRHLREVEAESVALLCIETLRLDGAVYSRGYLQHWLDSDEIPERSAQKVLNAADKILKAGRPIKPQEAGSKD